MLGGLTVPEIARAFLVQETTIGQRITRAKARGQSVLAAYLSRVNRIVMVSFAPWSESS